MPRIVKTSFEKEQREKDEMFLKLEPLERWRVRLKVRERMRKKDVDYSYQGMKVTVKRISESSE